MRNCFLVGDMNIDLHETSAIGKRYLNSLKMNGCYQGKKEPTCPTPSSKSLLDHIVHNDCLINLEFGVIKNQYYRSLCNLCPFEDNKISIHSFSTNQATRPFVRNGYHKGKYLNYLRHCLELSILEQDVDRLTESLADALITTVNVFTSKEKIKPAKSNKTWFHNDVKKSITRRSFAFNRYNRYRTPSDKINCTNMRNRVCELLQSKKLEYFNDRLTQFLNSPKRVFRELNRLTGRQKKNCNFIIAEDENKLNTDYCPVSHLFNEKFVSISKTLTASILTVPFTTEGLTNNEQSLFFFPTDSLEICKIVRNLKNNKAAGLDGLTAEMLKVSLVVICDRLTYLVNESLSSGVFPKILKAAKFQSLNLGKRTIVRSIDTYQFYQF